MINVGNRVYTKRIPNPNEFKKFASMWTGPCTVNKVFSPTKYEVKDQTTGKSSIVHIDNILFRGNKVEDPNLPDISTPE